MCAGLNGQLGGLIWTSGYPIFVKRISMKHLTILVPEGQNNLSSIVGAYKLFSRANAYWKANGKKEVFAIQLAGISKKVDFYDGLFTVNPHTHISTIRRTNLIIIPSLNHNYVQALKDRHLRQSVPLGKVIYDGKLQVMKHALGTHTSISRAHGGKLKASREIRIASVFRDAPADFLKMIVVHELAHIREAEHDKSFYRLCTHMEPDYHQLEFDLRLYLIHLDVCQR